SLGLLAAGWMWIPLALVAAIGAHTFMDNLSTSGHRPRRRLRALRYRQTWAVSWLYIGTFGSFVGLSTALPLLTKVQFPQADGAWYLFLGPLVGAGARPAGGWLADRLTGARVTLWNFLIMTAGAIGALVSLLADDY